MFVPLSGWAWAAVFGCVRQDVVYVFSDLCDVGGVDCSGGGCGEWWAVRVVLEKVWEFSFDLLGCCEICGGLVISSKLACGRCRGGAA